MIHALSLLALALPTRAALAAPVATRRPAVSLVALGCPKNTVDAEVMLGHLQREGYDIVAQPKDADVVIVNTCAFVEDAKRESIAAVIAAGEFKLDRSVPAKVLCVTGCLAQRYADELALELPEVDAVVGFEGYQDIPDKIAEALEANADGNSPDGSVAVAVGSPTGAFRSEEDRWRLTAAHTPYVRVAEGCDHACTFCAIPSFRGAFRSKPFDVLIAEAARLVEGGVRELNLIAEDTNQYGTDFGESDARRLPELLRALSTELPQLKWIRLLYCYPAPFSEELIDEIADNPKVVKYIDIPLQHLESNVLKRMRRPGGEATLALLRKLRARIPSLVLRTTFICGFPGETHEDHRELVRLARELGFERGGAFAHSQEDGTPAAEMGDQLDDETKLARRDELEALFQQRYASWASSLVGKTVRAMVDRMDGTDAVGRTEFDAPEIDQCVRIPGMALAPGTELRVRVVAVDPMSDIIAEPVMPSDAEY